MSEIKIFYNCYKYLELPDDYFMQLLIIIFGNLEMHYLYDSFEDINLYFKNTQVYVSTRSNWKNIIYTEFLRIDLRISKREYQKVLDYVT